MKRIGITLLVVLLIFSLAGCAGQDSAKAQSGQNQSITKKDLTPENKQPVATTSDQLAEVDSTLENLNEVVKSLEDVAIEELTIPTL